MFDFLFRFDDLIKHLEVNYKSTTKFQTSSERLSVDNKKTRSQSKLQTRFLFLNRFQSRK